MRLQTIVEEGSQAAQQLLGLTLEQSTLVAYDEREWGAFCGLNKFEKDSNGLYVPQSRKAYVRKESNTLCSDVYHELFGHGLFTEHSVIGRELDEIIQQGKDQKNYFEEERTASYPGIFSQRIWDYEGFAVWLEAHLCKETNNERAWYKKKQKTHPQYLQAREVLLAIEERAGRFSLLAQLGFPKYYDGQIIIDATKRLLGKEYVQSIDYLLLRGSQKPYSDIDLFSVSDNQIGELDLGWLDFYNMNKQTLEERAELLDIHVTDAIITGTCIYGDEKIHEKTKEKILKKPITRQAIEHNLKRSQEQQDIMKTLPPHSADWYTAQGYANSYRANAEQLKEGHKQLTLQKLETIYGTLREKKT